MTLPPNVPQLSFSAVVQLAAVLFAVTSTFLFSQFQTSANATNIQGLRVEYDAVHTGIDNRTRGLEIYRAESSVRDKRVEEDLQEIKESQGENQSMLRQLLRQSVGVAIP